MAYIYSQNDIYEFSRVVGAETKRIGKELNFKYCPYCQGGDNRDQNTFSINLETGAFHCFRAGCGRSGHFVEIARDFNFQLASDKEPPKFRRLKQRPIEVRDAAVSYMKSRGISEKTTKEYHVTSLKNDPNTIVFPFYDQNHVLTFVKYRNAKYVKGKSKGGKEWCEKNTKPILFGMDHCTNFDRLIIAEGEIDSLSISDCGIENATSVPTGCSGFTFLDHIWEWIIKFKEVVVFGDYEYGKVTLLETLAKRLPVKVKGVRPEDYLGEKDANDIYRKYGKQAILTAISRAQVPPVKHVKELADVKSVDLFSLPRIKTGLKELDEILSGGFFLGQVILLTGKRGNGKSTLMSQIMNEAVDQGYSVLAYSGELVDYHFKRWMDFQAAGPKHVVVDRSIYGEESFSIPDDVVQKINAWYRGKMYLYDNDAVDDEMEDLLVTVERTIQRYDVKLICIDNLMTAMDLDNGDLNKAQSAFVKALKKLAVRHNVAIILVAHPRKTQSAIENDDVSGSSDITNRVDVVLSYSRNMDKTDPNDSAPDSKLAVLKNRLTGKITSQGQEIGLFYSAKSKRISSLLSHDKVYGWEKEQFPTQNVADWLDDGDDDNEF